MSSAAINWQACYQILCEYSASVWNPKLTHCTLTVHSPWSDRLAGCIGIGIAHTVSTGEWDEVTEADAGGYVRQSTSTRQLYCPSPCNSSGNSSCNSSVNSGDNSGDNSNHNNTTITVTVQPLVLISISPTFCTPFCIFVTCSSFLFASALCCRILCRE